MPPPNTPEEGLTIQAPQPGYLARLRDQSPHPSSARAQASQGGSSIQEIDYQGLDYVGPVDETLFCPICKTPFHSPITTPCGHTFCAGCINRALETQRTCPIDRSTINKNRDYHQPPLIIKEQLDRLKVKCPNKGCDYVCSREHLEGHCERRCDFTPVCCPGPNCTKLVARRHATAEKGCQHQNVACEYCLKVMARVELEAHYDTDCDGTAAECPECYTTVARHRLGKHRSHDCPEGQTQCKWRIAGCGEAGKRWAIQEHEQSGCRFEAVGRLVEHWADNRKFFDDLDRRLSTLEASHNRQRERENAAAEANQTTNPPSLSITTTSTSTDNPTSNLTTITTTPATTTQGQNPPSTDNTTTWTSPETYMLARIERLETRMEQLGKQAHEADTLQSLNFHQLTTHIAEQLTELASKVGMLNLHTNYLMNVQRQSHAQQRAGSAAGAASAAGAGPSGSSSGVARGSGDSAGSGSGRPGSSSDGGGRPYQGASRRSSDGRGENLTRL